MFDYSINSNHLYIAQSFMDQTLNDLMELRDNQIDIISTINISIELIKQIQIIHDLNLVHGDIKEANLCYENLTSSNIANYKNMGFIDFSSSQIFKNKNKIIDLDFGQKSICTREYASLGYLKEKHLLEKMI